MANLISVLSSPSLFSVDGDSDFSPWTSMPSWVLWASAKLQRTVRLEKKKRKLKWVCYLQKARQRFHFLLEGSVTKYGAFLQMLFHLDVDPVGYDPICYLQDTTKPVIVTKIPPDPSKDGGWEVIYLHVPWTECHNQWMESWKWQHPWRFFGVYNCGFGWKGSRLHPGSEVGLWHSERWWCWTRSCHKKNVLIVDKHFCSPL